MGDAAAAAARLERLEAKVDNILSLLRETHTNARRMGSHIDTVETVIDQFQKPAYFVKHYVERFLMRGDEKSGSGMAAPIDFAVTPASNLSLTSPREP